MYRILALFNTLRMPLGFLPMVIGGIVESKVALIRIQTFLLAEDIDENAVENVTSEDGKAISYARNHLFLFLSFSEVKEVVIRAEDASFKWGGSSNLFSLQNLNFTVKRGELVAVVGTVGSGKVHSISFRHFLTCSC